jgi:hypothetical protein
LRLMSKIQNASALAVNFAMYYEKE